MLSTPSSSFWLTFLFFAYNFTFFPFINIFYSSSLFFTPYRYFFISLSTFASSLLFFRFFAHVLLHLPLFSRFSSPLPFFHPLFAIFQLFLHFFISTYVTLPGSFFTFRAPQNVSRETSFFTIFGLQWSVRDDLLFLFLKITLVFGPSDF